jgi:hypothetical protein
MEHVYLENFPKIKVYKCKNELNKLSFSKWLYPLVFNVMKNALMAVFSVLYVMKNALMAVFSVLRARCGCTVHVFPCQKNCWVSGQMPICRVRVMVLNATFNNISDISWRANMQFLCRNCCFTYGQFNGAKSLERFVNFIVYLTV